MLDKSRKLELIRRSLGIRHKLKVQESTKAPDTHEDLAIMLLSKWELEDELRAIEEIIAQQRASNVANKRLGIEKENQSYDSKPSYEREYRTNAQSYLSE